MQGMFEGAHVGDTFKLGAVEATVVDIEDGDIVIEYTFQKLTHRVLLQDLIV